MFRENDYQTKGCCLCGKLTESEPKKGWRTGFAATAADICPECVATLQGKGKLNFRDLLAGLLHKLGSRVYQIHAVAYDIAPEILKDSYVAEKARLIENSAKLFIQPEADNNDGEDNYQDDDGIEGVELEPYDNCSDDISEEEK